ncbi:MAG: Asp-tRNA(Asn)/Glu-tRNA(Gln) amidotransferase subunit GatA [Actinobacteria bacterium]|nr:Asp-tRNA(Asn)/Glu-tRNA(Gln) amidotransferase subunit GatA [Actinomycetota bacterium]NCV96832.1 Asp-tRNA(Asn)/Glu-tRNA(Gln) amidotransferase subunit GatA [Acidimicrobiia bacterium]NCV09205.1 Asp-tRNA(Asn)/Glu-tRNA(Gln) amidotransferase subunit GatA [Actinomycetota bacterium]NCX17456.1 Asp-tRNA(Asn)/Glu-tRNA(Gln) amidotransferase subunit GatA [Acidimicrobiia bacterium]NCZ55082.1 Asp-tRNA(Asn)/Glu-tRNA(Gln) amidotransferase subunit GatA [Acidimicrobiia bacterium]
MTRRTVVDIATQVAAGSLSASTVLEENLAAITAREHEIHAFNLVTADRARERAAEIDADVKAGKKVGRLAGVTISLKDNMCTRGVETTCSSKILAGWKPPYDATVVRRLADEGAVFVGKTNLDEFAMGSSTENSAFGPTRNPLDTSRVPGGSSGGSAAAVAAGFSAASFGSDTGGSIRQPAALCGLVGVKPTYGMVSRQGLIAFGSSLDQIGPFTTTVADAALLMEVIAGHDPLDSTSLPQPAPQLTSVLANGVKGLRIGRVADMPEGSSPDVLARLDAAFEALRAAGATVVDVKLPSMSFGLTAYYLVAPAEASSNLARFDGVRYGLRVDAKDLNAMYGATRAAGFGDEVKRRIMLGTYALSAGYYDAYYGKALKVRRLIADDFAKAYAQCDAILTPTSPTVAFKFGDKTSNPLAMYLCDVFTIPTNLAGHAAMSVPFGTGEAGLPVGVQVLAPALGEATMFRVAAELERAS